MNQQYEVETNPPQSKYNTMPQQYLSTWCRKLHAEYFTKSILMIYDPRYILLKVTATTICGSNPYLCNETVVYMHDDDILGHEFMGIIAQIDLSDHRILQEPLGNFGKNHRELLCGQASYIRVPFADMNCLPIPNDVPDDKALYLSDIIPTVYHGCHIANVKEGSIVAIWCLGSIGLLQTR
ncbi:unnamed protein product [Rotaria sp. Silwood2]|nr:unnamed protein product [Rotaria sp. Silwood2]